MTFPFPFSNRGCQLTTWNPSDKSAGVALSNGNLTATASAGGAEAARVLRGFSQGIRYAEISPTTVNISFIGIGTASAALTFPGGDANGHGYLNDGHRHTSGSDQGAYGSTWTTTDVIGILLNMTVPNVTFYKNGVSQGAISIAAGTWFVMVGEGTAGAVTNVWTFNGGSSDFTGSLPAGASKWND